MALTGCYGAVGEAQSIGAIRHALDAGINFIDTADAYAGGQNEEVVGRALAGRRREVLLATKFGVVFEDGVSGTPLTVNESIHLRINGTAQYVRQAIDRSLQRLDTDVVDLWYAHYLDPATPVEVTVGAMAEQVAKGKVRWLGLSNVTAEQLRRANGIHPITAVQGEYSLFNRQAEAGLLAAARELGAGFVAWAPLGRGFLSGSVSRVGADDFRSNLQPFQAGRLAANNARFAPVWALAAEIGITPAQLALAWLLHRGESIVPIPGTRHPRHIEQNASAAEFRLDDALLAQLDRLAPAGLAVE
jgi:aryl-alcohol dehydrogenase-like predicted oxidoreductase